MHIHEMRNKEIVRRDNKERKKAEASQLGNLNGVSRIPKEVQKEEILGR